jgi:hypothetical protein
MAKTATAANACNVAVWLDDDADTLKDISGSSNSLSISATQKHGGFEVFGESWMQYLCCGRDMSVTLNFVYSSTENESWDIIQTWYFGTSSCAVRTLDIYIPTKDVGSDYITAEVTIESLDYTADRADAGPVAASVTFRAKSGWTRSVAAT